ncbi:MAG: cobalamin B12-binding domain-containing protein [Candidatus Helarchaeota archaeon]
MIEEMRESPKLEVQQNLLNEIKEAIINVDEEPEIEKLVQSAVELNIELVTLVKCISDALEEVGNLYESMEYFLSELLISGDRAKRGIDVLKPFIAKEKDKFLGTIIFGSVKGDIHDIGKTIISAFLIGAGFIIHDLGVEVSSDKFIEAIKEYNPEILAMSTLLTSCLDEMKNTIDAIKQAGLREGIKIIVGGRPVSKEFAVKIGADAFAFYPVDAVEECKRLIKELKQ